MVSQELLYWTLVTGWLSALATGLGALPVLFLRGRVLAFQAVASAAAAGMMISAAVFSIGEKSVLLDHSRTYVGVLLGAGLLYFLDRFHHHDNDVANSEDSGKAKKNPVRASNLLLLAMMLHSIPEGVAIGVGFATEDLAFGLTMACAIAIHNVPEGIAISLPLSARGESFGRCFRDSVLSSLPQPTFAVPALYLGATIAPFQPFGLGFAAGAMIYLAVVELLPEAVETGGRRQALLGVVLGLVSMYALNQMLALAHGIV